MFAKPAHVPLLPRFERGQLVRIRPLDYCRHRAETGIVMQVRLRNDGVRALDKYIVQFPDNDQEEFWGIQLEPEPQV